MKRHVSFAIICFVIVLIFSAAYFSPTQYVKRYVPAGDESAVFTVSDITLMNDCEISSLGEIHVKGLEPYIVFENVDVQAAGIVVNGGSKFESNMSGKLYVDSTGDGFETGQVYYAPGAADSEYMCFSLPSTNIKNIRIAVDKDYQFKNISIYEDSPIAENVEIKPDFLRYVLSLIVALIGACIAFYADKKWDLTGSGIKLLRENCLKIGIFFGGCIIICLMSILAEFLIRHYIVDVSTLGIYFNKQRYFFICHLFIGIYTIVFLRKYLERKPEYVFLPIILIVGSMMILVSPFGHNSWDGETHYKWASNASYYKEANVTMADYEFDAYSAAVQPKQTSLQNESGISHMNEIYEFQIGYRTTDTTIAHRLSGWFIAVIRMFGGNFYTLYLVGEYVILFTYAIVCFFAMKRLNSGKMILAVIALLPTNMFLATNYSYDYWVTCFSLLGMSYFLSELQKPEKPVSTKNTVIMAGAFAIASLPKLIYATLLAIPFFMKKKNLSKKERKKYYFICGGVILLLFVLLALTALKEVSGTGDLRGGMDVNPAGQIMYILHNPFIYAKDLLKFIISYLSPFNASGYMVHFAYFGVGSGAAIILALLIFVTITDKNQYDYISSSWIVRIVNLLIFGGTIVLVATALYVSYTPVGSHVINGCQPRYLIPLLFPLLSVIGYSKFNNKMNRSLYNGSIMVAMTILIYWNVYNMILPRLI